MSTMTAVRTIMAAIKRAWHVANGSRKASEYDQLPFERVVWGGFGKALIGIFVILSAGGVLLVSWDVLRITHGLLMDGSGPGAIVPAIAHWMVEQVSDLGLKWLALIALFVGAYVVLLPFLPLFSLLPKKKRPGNFQDLHGRFYATKEEADAATKMLEECHNIGHVDLGPEWEKRRQEGLAELRRKAREQYDN